ncbi:hypothetical protein DSO57_1033244 [Entomophthora muscae]|uniref:Uncharacterized protein n=1 Tax=Entomophthora muscae TaxID=34485 RepID=A0ACC2SD21_9FUNG|nr:hypothetical protein DSO57_1033244 [Entomophthora muscae]
MIPAPNSRLKLFFPDQLAVQKNAARASPIAESCSRGRESNLKSASPVPSTASQENADLEALKSLRQDIQKATVKEGYADHEIIAERLIQLEDTPVTASTIMQSKIGKLLRHLLTNHIPTNDYDFRARFRSLFTHYKVVVAEAPEAANSSPNNGEARESQHSSSESKIRSQLPEAPSSPQSSTVKAECKQNAPEQTQSLAPVEPKPDENTTTEDSKHAESNAADNSKQDESLPAEHEDNKIPPSADLSSEDKNEAVSPKESSASIHNPTEVPVANSQALICTD